MMIPDIVKEYILNKCKNGKGVQVTLVDPATKRLVGKLEFDENGFSRTLTEQVGVIGYIQRLLTFSRKDVMIFVDEESLDKIPPLLNNNTDAGRQVAGQGS